MHSDRSVKAFSYKLYERSEWANDRALRVNKRMSISCHSYSWCFLNIHRKQLLLKWKTTTIFHHCCCCRHHNHHHHTMDKMTNWLWNERVEHWAIRSSARSFAHTAHSFACSTLLASITRSTALILLLARLLSHSHGKGGFVYESNALILYPFNLQCAATITATTFTTAASTATATKKLFPE